MVWQVTIKPSAGKRLAKFPSKVKFITQLLVEALKLNGPFPGKDWPNYSKLELGLHSDKRHCHLIKGRPTYVACWELLDKTNKRIEIYYVGTHEKAPY